MCSQLYHKQKAIWVPLLVLVILAGIWHFGIAGSSGQAMLKSILNLGSTPEPWIYDYYGLEIDNPWLKLEGREPVVQKAFGMNLREDAPVPEIIEIAFNWIVVGMITLGLVVLILRKRLELQFGVLAVALYALVVFTVLIPWLSMYYGGQRVFFTSLIVLAPCFVLGVGETARKLKVNQVAFSIIVLVTYVFATSGLLYSLWGISK